MENNKELYFTPEIEDIRVGYKCESTNNGKDWYNWVFQEHNFGALELELMNSMYRTSYLIKEDIESKGWVFGTNNFGLKYYAIKGNYIIRARALFYDPHWLKIFNFHTTYTGDCIFEGKCKSINEFNYICKLLEID